MIGLFSLLFLSVLLFAQTNPSVSDTCTRAGAAFAVDPLTNGLLIKDAKGYIAHFDIGRDTKIVKLPVGGEGRSAQGQTIEAGQIQPGDLVCVQSQGEKGPVTSVTVVSRVDIESAQRQFVSEWQRDTVFGSISNLEKDKMAVKASSGEAVDVHLDDAAIYRTIPLAATQISDARQIKRTDLKVGDMVFVRGHRSAGDPALKAKTVVTGGFRAIIGTFLEARPLDRTVKLREYGTKTDLLVRIPDRAIYRTAAQLNHPNRIVGPNDLTLVPLGASDLQAGDVVLVVGKSDASANSAQGLAMITRFGYFGSAPGGDKQKIEWLLK